MTAIVLGKRVLLFTASGTYRGESGVVEAKGRRGAWVRLDADGDRLFFKAGEMVPEEESTPEMVAGD